MMTVALLAALGSQACKKEPEASEETPAASAEKDQGPALDPELAKAMAAASGAPPPAAAPAPGEGPPPRGIFGPGGADKAHNAGAPPSVELGSAGAEPRVKLSPGFESSQKTTIQLALQADPRQPPLPIDFALEFGSKDESNADAGPAKRPMTATVKQVGVAAASGRIPPEAQAAFDKLKGSTISFDLWPNGGASGFEVKASEGAQSDLVDMLLALSDALAVALLPYPNEAVGTGGFWMATSREPVLGLDLVTYRLIRVERADPGGVTLNVGVKRYAASSAFDLMGLRAQGPFTLEEIAAGGEGKVRYQPGASLPQGGQLQLSIAAAVIPAGQPDQRGQVQMATLSRFGSSAQAPPTGAAPMGAPPGRGMPRRPPMRSAPPTRSAPPPAP